MEMINALIGFAVTCALTYLGIVAVGTIIVFAFQYWYISVPLVMFLIYLIKLSYNTSK